MQAAATCSLRSNNTAYSPAVNYTQFFASRYGATLRRSALRRARYCLINTHGGAHLHPRSGAKIKHFDAWSAVCGVISPEAALMRRHTNLFL